MIHNENIALSCNTDGNDFIQNTSLNEHISSVHERKKPYTSLHVLYTYQPSSYIDLRRTRDRFDVHMKLSLLQYCA